MTEEITHEDLLYFNGINASTGNYGLPPMRGEELAEFIKGVKKPENFDELEARYKTKDIRKYGVKEGVDPSNLAEAGWGVIFPTGFNPAIKEALQPLLDWRKSQATQIKNRYRCYDGQESGPNGELLEPYYPDESKSDFLGRNGVGFGPADPDKVPYYLLLVGSPQEIPYEFQYHLDVQYAVGRIHFDTIEAYANYAQSVVAVEKGQVKLPRQVTFFGTKNGDDEATRLSSAYLIQPLLDKLKSETTWTFDACLGEQASKTQLSQLLGGDKTPALLFTASHGAEFDLGDSHQIPHQGALICQEYPGPKEWKARHGGNWSPLTQDVYFAGDDLSSDKSLLGLLAFFFACYGAGTPQEDEFYEQAFSQPKAIAPYPFVAQLPMKLLSHPRGGALAAVGHVERAWAYSFLWPDAGSEAQTVAFESTIKALLAGKTIGVAIEYFNEKYAEYSTVLTDTLKKVKAGKQVSPYKLANLWTANNDSRNFVIIGDPAVRLPVAEPGGAAQPRPVLELSTIPVVNFSATTMTSTTVTHIETDTPVSSAKATPFNQAEVDFGLRETTADIAAQLRPIAQKLVERLNEAVDNLTSLEIQTYTTSDLRQVAYDNKAHTFSDAAVLRALTRISLDGDILSLVPERKRPASEDKAEQVTVEIDEQLWQIHREMVNLAQRNKVAFVQALAEIATSLVKLT